MADTTILQTMAKEQSVIILFQNAYMPLWYTLSIMNSSKENALDIANLFYESGLYGACQPDFIETNKMLCTTSDSLFSAQWGLKNIGQENGTNGIDINYCEAKNITMGDTSVTVAIIDSDIDITNEDLNNVNIPFYLGGLPDGNVITNDHGIDRSSLVGGEHYSILMTTDIDDSSST